MEGKIDGRERGCGEDSILKKNKYTFNSSEYIVQ